MAVTVTIENTETGHSVPSGFHTRNMILLLTVTDSGGTPLAQLGGEVIPDWAGAGDPGNGDSAGLPGTGYAKILGDDLGNELVFYTDATKVISDNRIPAHGSDSTSYLFTDPGPGAGTIQVTAELLYRRSWKAVMDEKLWGIPDVVMEQATQALPLEQPVSLSLEVVGPSQIPRGDFLRIRATHTNNLDLALIASSRAGCVSPVGSTVVKGRASPWPSPHSTSWSRSTTSRSTPMPRWGCTAWMASRRWTGSNRTAPRSPSR